VVHKDVKLNCGYRLDRVVEDEVIIEVKAIERPAPIHDAQLLSDLRVSGKSEGSIINFPVRQLKNGLKRIVNEFPDSARSVVSKRSGE
jgi:GxxExxY protein